MRSLSNYVLCRRRMNRRPYTQILIAYLCAFLILIMSSILIGNFLTREIRGHQPTTSMETPTPPTAAAFLDRVSAIYYQKLLALGVCIGSLVICLAFMPALAMRLKDLNYTPSLALGFLCLPLQTLILYARGSPHSYWFVIIVPGLCLASQTLAALSVGTQGCNRFGEDPLRDLPAEAGLQSKESV